MALPPENPMNDDQHVDSWLISYADLITLLLCFFVIIVSMSKPQEERIKTATETIRKEFGQKGEVPKVAYLTGDDILILRPNAPIVGDIEKVITSSPELKAVANVTETEDGKVVIELKSSYFYESGSAEFKGEGKQILTELAERLSKPEYESFKISVEGHTDDAPIKTDRYPSNWELSTARATNVVRFLIDKGFSPQRLKASGYADSLPKLPNRDASGKAILENQAQNRRIILTLERPQEKKPPE